MEAGDDPYEKKRAIPVEIKEVDKCRFETREQQ